MKYIFNIKIEFDDHDDPCARERVNNLINKHNLLDFGLKTKLRLLKIYKDKEPKLIKLNSMD